MTRTTIHPLAVKTLDQQFRCPVLSENTIRHMVSEILQKLHVNNRAEAAAYAIREGLITPGS